VTHPLFIISIEIELTIIFKKAIDLIFVFNSLKFKGQSV
jgi:hypothetical protein